MKRLMTFESFVHEDEEVPQNTQGNTYFLYIYDANPDTFSGEVRDADGQVVYTVDAKSLEDGAMQTPDDITGLRKFLVEKKKLKELDVIEIAQAAPTAPATVETN